MKVLSKLYNSYKEDFKDTSLTYTNSSKTKGDLYLQMCLTLSLTHSSKVGLWVTGTTGEPSDKNGSTAENRYLIYKQLYLQNRLDNNLFENLTIEEMRFVMNNIIDDEEIEWLNYYTKLTTTNPRNPYSYINYTSGYNYSLAKYVDISLKDVWDAKYNLSAHGVSYGYEKLWVVFEEGSVCGGIAKLGSNINGCYGVPSSVVSQPGHAAYIYVSLNNGKKFWNLYNDVSGWSKSGKTEKLSVRMPNGWGSGSYASGYPATYILLAQSALDDKENYKLCEEKLMMLDIAENYDEKVDICENAISIQNINFDAWYNLVNLYKLNSNTTQQDYYEIACRITENLKYYPLPMYDLLKLIEPKLIDAEYIAAYNHLLNTTLTKMTKLTPNDYIQSSAAKQVASYLLGMSDTTIATFSFDGDNKNKIVLSNKFDDVGIQWQYSIDGGENWTSTSLHKQELTTEEIESITAEKDILIRVVGALDNVYTLNIEKGATPTNIYANDLENKILGETSKLEWKLNESDSWTEYSQSIPDLSGNKNVYVRKKANLNYLAGEKVQYTFTEDSNDETKKYIPISNISIEGFSSNQNGEPPTNLIDGRTDTMWHTLHNGSDKEKYVVFKLSEPKYISALDYLPRQNGTNGMVKNLLVFASENGEDYIPVNSGTNWAYNKTLKTINLETHIKAKYIKIVGKVTSGSFMSGNMINLYEDTTIKEHVEVYFKDGDNVIYKEEIKKGSKISEITPESKAGYDFVGWYKDEELTEPFNFDSTLNVDTNIYSKWYKHPELRYSIKFNANGGSGTMEDITNVLGQYILPECTYTPPSGKEFLGWSRFNDGETIEKVDEISDITVYAIWKDLPKIEYKVTFDANGGNGIMENLENICGEYTLPECTFTAEDGKMFAGWSKEKNGNIIDKVNEIEDIVVYAIWKDIPEEKHTITFYSNDGKNLKDEVKSIYGIYVLPSCNFTPATGKKFKGWSTSCENGNIITEIHIVKDTNIYAIWEDEEEIKDDYRNDVENEDKEIKENDKKDEVKDEDKEEKNTTLKILNGENQEYIINETSELTIRASGDFNKFTNLKLDGIIIDKENYTAVSGSTIVTLKASYLNTIEEGDHTLTFEYTDGEISTNIKITKNIQENEDSNIKEVNNNKTKEEKDNNPKTSDGILTTIRIFIFSIISIGVAAKKSKKRKVN